MSEKAALITGASRGIGLAIAEALGADGYSLTLSARKPDSLAATAESLSAKGYDVAQLATNMNDEAGLRSLVQMHKERFGRLDVLVNNAGVGIGASAGEHQTKFVDMQLGVNLRSVVLMYRECLPLLREAGARDGADVINLASITGRSPQPWLSVYSATKAAVIAYTVAMNRELAAEGIRSVALAPGFVDTDMSDFVKESVAAEEMIKPADIAAGVRFVLSLSRACVVPEIVFERPGETV
jgi:NAD(P)-dependent dehydrogenase (short-subunit alcohol dehydrogenase family)